MTTLTIEKSAAEKSAARRGASAPGNLVISPVAGYIGAEISGIDLRQRLDNDIVAAVRQALLTYKVIFFRDQFIDHTQHIEFARRFGKLTAAHPHDDTPPDGYPEIFAIDTDRYQGLFGKASYDSEWHTDLTPVINPPFASILRADTVPEYGGDTQWTNLVAAYENMPEELRAFADTLRAKHIFEPIGMANTSSDWGKKMAENPLIAIHPVVRVSPETGERALYVSPTFTNAAREIVGFTRKQSERILELFHEEIMKPQYTVRFRWRPGSIAFWDNRTTAHLAPSDVSHLEYGRRLLYRVTMEGDVPVGPDGRLSERIAGKEFLALPHGSSDTSLASA